MYLEWNNRSILIELLNQSNVFLARFDCIGGVEPKDNAGRGKPESSLIIVIMHSRRQ